MESTPTEPQQPPPLGETEVAAVQLLPPTDVEAADKAHHAHMPPSTALLDMSLVERLAKQRQQLEDQTAVLMSLIDRQKTLTGACVHPLKGVTDTKAATDPQQQLRNSELRVGDSKASWRALSAEQESALLDTFSIKDHLSRSEMRALSERIGISEYTIRSAFQALRARMRKGLAKATQRASVVKTDALAAAAASASTSPSAETLMQAVTANRSHDDALSGQLRLVVSSAAGGGLAQASFAPLFVALMTSAKTPGMRSTLSDALAASGACAGGLAALVESRVVNALAAWVADAEGQRHTTLLHKYMRAAHVLPVTKPDMVAPLAVPLNKCRQYRLSRDVADAATQLLAQWGRAFSGLGPGPSQGGGLAMSGPMPPRALGAAPHGAPSTAVPASHTFSGPALSKAAVAARIAAPAPIVTKRTVDERLAGVNERAAVSARPMSADDILKKKRMAAQQSGGLMAAPIVKRNRGVGGAPLAPPLPVRPQPVASAPLESKALEWCGAPPALVCPPPGEGYGSLSEEAGVQASRQAEQAAAIYVLPSLIPDDPAVPLELRHAQPPQPVAVISEEALEAEDRERQVSVLRAHGHPQGWHSNSVEYGGNTMYP